MKNHKTDKQWQFVHIKRSWTRFFFCFNSFNKIYKYFSYFTKEFLILPQNLSHFYWWSWMLLSLQTSVLLLVSQTGSGLHIYSYASSWSFSVKTDRKRIKTTGGIVLLETLRQLHIFWIFRRMSAFERASSPKLNYLFMCLLAHLLLVTHLLSNLLV